jgi:hypothetical protein
MGKKERKKESVTITYVFCWGKKEKLGKQESETIYSSH